MKKWRVTKPIKYSGMHVTAGAIIEMDDVAQIARYKKAEAIEAFEEKLHPEKKVAEQTVETAVKEIPQRRGRKKTGLRVSSE